MTGIVKHGPSQRHTARVMLRRSMFGEHEMAEASVPRSEPAKVYPAPDIAGRWIVEAPPGLPPRDEPMPPQFSGPRALDQALKYAYEHYGSARFFPF